MLIKNMHNVSYQLIKKEFKKNGYVLLKNFFQKNQIQTIKSEIKRIKLNNSACKIYFEKIESKKVIRRIENFSKNISSINQILKTEKLMKIMYDLMGSNVSIFKEKINFKKAKNGNGFNLHIDGHFYWKNKAGVKKKGWKEYSNKFINLVIPLDQCTKRNGCLKLYTKDVTKKIVGVGWEKITKKLYNHGPFLDQKISIKDKPFFAEMNIGDVLLFDWKCIHGSDNNKSDDDRAILYITYNSSKDGDLMTRYFKDKNESRGDQYSKSLA